MDTKQKIKILMIKKGYGDHGGQRRLAAKIGVSESTFSMALNGHRTNPKSIKSLLDALDYLKAL
jgi:hypothetical protein